MKKVSKSQIAMIVFVITIAYINVSLLVFAIRHPWLTDTERLLHIGDALTFSTVTKP